MPLWIGYALLAAFFGALDRLSIVFVFVLAVLFLGDAFTANAALCAALVVAGAILLT